MKKDLKPYEVPIGVEDMIWEPEYQLLIDAVKATANDDCIIHLDTLGVMHLGREINKRFVPRTQIKNLQDEIKSLSKGLAAAVEDYNNERKKFNSLQEKVKKLHKYHTNIGTVGDTAMSIAYNKALKLIEEMKS